MPVSRENVAPELLAAVKQRLRITRDFSQGDVDLTGIIARGMAYLDDLTAVALDYDAEDKPRELLMEYCRYVNADALDEFVDNYLPELRRLQINAELGKYDTESEQEDGL